ncbi:MAG: bifunctional 5,10-methylenetetrahydrofolate dehydrogenase/5,10-methenyltetrahydrofolate cyclohydrolase [Phycisphaeraceae bacterium]|nr:MAG: bifunctional 5,10-methylenetetrahydrofolate dehydrogenase/5,10-methenyltetrahydrofolate cyclohydrolase [Phycisphaeraceae bacterium]
MATEAQIIDGKELARLEREGIADRAEAVRAAGGTVSLDAVLVDTGRAGGGGARVYAENQAKTCGALGIDYNLHELGADTDEKSLLGVIDGLNADRNVRAIMVHMPLPASIDEHKIKSRIGPEKDVEGVNPANIGNIVYGYSSFAPCTALATLRLIDSTGIELRGKRAVVVGASNTVGKPAAALLMTRDATVVSCNEWTEGIEELARSADVLVAAAGRAGLVTPEWVKPGAAVIDVGVNRVIGADGKGRVVGDVDFEGVRHVAGWLSPVPGGVGPMTVAVLLGNVVEVAMRSLGPG